MICGKLYLHDAVQSAQVFYPVDFSFVCGPDTPFLN